MPRRSSSFARRWRARVRSVTASSRARQRSRTASWSMVGGCTAVSRSARSSSGQLPGVAAVGLDAVAGPPGDQRRRDHPAFDAFGLELALQREATRTGLVAGHDRPRRHALQALRKPLHRPRLVRQLPLLGPSALRRQHRDPDRRCVCIHPCVCGSHLPDRLPFVCGSVASRRNPRVCELGAGHSIRSTTPSSPIAPGR